MSKQYVMALDGGSTSARGVLVNLDGRIVAEARNPVVPNFPRTGWVELDPVAIWRAQRDSMEAAMRKVGATTDDIAAIGLTLKTGKAHVMRAGLEAMAYQTRDNVEALKAGGLSIPELKVDGGAARNNLLCQFQSS